MSFLGNNLKYLLVSKGVKPGFWIEILSDQLGFDKTKATQLMMGEAVTLNDEEKNRLEDWTEYGIADLGSKELWLGSSEKQNIRHNLLFLLGLLERGDKKEFAKKIGVDTTTISRWQGGHHQPNRTKIKSIVVYFNLPNTTDLRKEHLYLWNRPTSSSQMKKWLHEKLEQMDDYSLCEIFPALEKLLT